MPESTGTITLTNGSASVIGSETKFSSNFVGADDLLVVVSGIYSSIYIVKSVSSDTALTLTREYEGETESGMAYDIVRTQGEQALNELAQQVAALVNKYRTIANAVQTEAGANKIPMAGEDGTIDDGWISDNFVTKAEAAPSAETLATARTFLTDLESGEAASFDGSADVTPGVAGVLPVANGGTGSSEEKYLTLEDAEEIYSMLVSGKVNAALLDDDGNALTDGDGAKLVAQWNTCSCS